MAFILNNTKGQQLISVRMAKRQPKRTHCTLWYIEGQKLFVTYRGLVNKLPHNFMLMVIHIKSNRQRLFLHLLFESGVAFQQWQRSQLNYIKSTWNLRMVVISQLENLFCYFVPKDYSRHILISWCLYKPDELTKFHLYQT